MVGLQPREPSGRMRASTGFRAGVTLPILWRRSGPEREPMFAPVSATCERREAGIRQRRNGHLEHWASSRAQIGRACAAATRNCSGASIPTTTVAIDRMKGGYRKWSTRISCCARKPRRPDQAPTASRIRRMREAGASLQCVRSIEEVVDRIDDLTRVNVDEKYVVIIPHPTIRPVGFGEAIVVWVVDQIARPVKLRP